MKKILALLLAVVMLSGCAPTPTSTVELPKSFIAETDITVSETTYKVGLTRYGDGCWHAEVLEPLAVRGLTFDYDGGSVTPGYKGLSFTFDKSRFPAGAVVSTVVDSLDRLIPYPVDVIVGDEGLLASGEVGGESFAMSLTKAGIPERIEIGEMKVEFSTLNILEEEQ